MTDHGKEFHHCPWPGCVRRIPTRVWGCIEPWNRVPYALRVRMRKAMAADDSVEVNAIRAEISRWVEENSEEPPEQVRVQLSAAEQIGFAAGITDDGRVFMIWPARGEFSTLTREESAILVKAVRAMLTTT